MNLTETTTRLLESASSRNEQDPHRLAELVYDQLRERASRLLRTERSDHTLDPTALVHEVYMKMVDQTRVSWHGRTHFLAVAADQMRRLLIDHARRRNAQKRGSGKKPAPLAVDIALQEDPVVDAERIVAQLQRLEQEDERAARVVTLSIFAGLTQQQIGEALGVSTRTVREDWNWARAWLRRALATET